MPDPEQGPHEIGVEIIPVGMFEVAGYVCQVEIYLVPLCRHIDPKDVANPLRVDHRGDRAIGMAQHIPFRFSLLRIDTGVHQHIEDPFSDAAFFFGKLIQFDAGRIDEDLRHCAAVDMHFRIHFSVDLHK